MKRVLVTSICFILSGMPLIASVDMGIPNPQTSLEDLVSLHDAKIEKFTFGPKHQIKAPDTFVINEEDREKFVTPHKASFHELTTAVRKLGEVRLKEVFGQPATIDKSYIIPFTGSSGVGFSGLGYTGKGRYYFLKIHDLGALIVYPYGNEQFVSDVAVYLKKDDQYIQSPKEGSLSKRIQWEQDKLNRIREAIDKLSE